MYKKTEYDERSMPELRSIAKINRERKGIFENYRDTDIKILTRRQIIYMLEIEKKYLELRRDI